MQYLARRNITAKGQVICDPFMGSGAIGVGALNCDCSFVGMELSQRTFFQALHNLARELQKLC